MIGRISLAIIALSFAACGVDEPEGENPSKRDNPLRLPDPAAPDPTDPDPTDPEPTDPDPTDPTPDPTPDPTTSPDPTDPTPDPIFTTPSCGPLECAASPGVCGLVFTDSRGCSAACADAGLTCAAAWDDLVGVCAADEARPSLPCDTGHESDYCLCALPDACEAGLCDAPVEAPLPPPDCTELPYSPAALLAERAGFGRGVTGGDPGNVYRVTSTSGGAGPGTLRRALESSEDYWIVFDEDMEITLGTTPVEVRTHKTVDGRGRDVHVRGNLRLEDTRNVILTDLRLSNDLEGHCTQAGDVLLLTGAGAANPGDFATRDIWIHHVELFNGGDGLLDLRGASNVTVSWTHLHTHKKGLLMWDDANQEPTPGMRVTMHHNWFDRISLRGPQFVYGQLHYFNNVQDRWYEYGLGALGDSQVLSENNVYIARAACELAAYLAGDCADPNPCGDNQPYDGRTNAIVHEWASNGVGSVRSVGDVFENGALGPENNPEQVFAPDYGYAADPAGETLVDDVTGGAGPRTGYCR